MRIRTGGCKDVSPQFLIAMRRSWDGDLGTTEVIHTCLVVLGVVDADRQFRKSACKLIPTDKTHK